MNSLISATADFTAAVFILGLLIGSFAGLKERSTSGRYLVILLADLLVMLVSQGVWYIFIYLGTVNILLELIAVSSYFALLTIYPIYIRYIITEKNECSVVWAIAACIVGTAGLLYWIWSRVTGLVFIGSDGQTTPGVFYVIGQIFGYVLIMMVVIMLIIHRGSFTPGSMALHLGYIAVPSAVSVIRSYVGGPNLLYTAIAVMLFAIAMSDRIRELRDCMDQRSHISDMEMALLVQQVQPHFLYNILNTVYHLCSRDPESAKELLGDFSDYLRTNLSAITSQEPVPVSWELQTVENYVRLEKARFEERLEIEYDIACQDFMLPPLSVRPLVENAIVHGMGKVAHPLHIRISTCDHPDRYEVMVTDDGPGYVDGVYPDDGRKHVGLINLRKRLSMMVDGVLEISGKHEMGTTAIIRIPKRKK